MVLREQDKHFLGSLYSAVAIIFAWKGLWEGIYEIPVISDYIGDPFVFLFIGFTMLTLSGLIFKEFDPLGGLEKAVEQKLHTVSSHPQKSEFQIRYHDKSTKKDVTISAANLERIEKGTLIIHDPKQRQELFIPMHRVTELIYQGQTYWKL